MYVQIQFVGKFCSIWQNIGWPMTASHTMHLQWLSFLLFNQHLLSKAFTSVLGYFTISGVNWSRFLDAGSSYSCITNKVKTLTEELTRWQISTMATTTMTIIKNKNKYFKNKKTKVTAMTSRADRARNAWQNCSSVVAFGSRAMNVNCCWSGKHVANAIRFRACAISVFYISNTNRSNIQLTLNRLNCNKLH